MKALILITLVAFLFGCSPKEKFQLTRAQVIEKEKGMRGEIIQISGTDSEGPYRLAGGFVSNRGDLEGKFGVRTPKGEATIEWKPDSTSFYDAYGYATEAGDVLFILRRIK